MIQHNSLFTMVNQNAICSMVHEDDFLSFITRHFFHRTLLGKRRRFVSFRRFFGFVVRHPYFDLHWSPQSSICDPCSVDFRYFVKLETFDEDIRELLREVTSEVVLEDIPYERKSSKKKSESMKNMLMKVNPVLLRKYLRIFKIDFDLFGYDFDKFKSFIEDIIKTKEKNK